MLSAPLPGVDMAFRSQRGPPAATQPSFCALLALLIAFPTHLQ